jgi:hypothetical protein
LLLGGAGRSLGVAPWRGVAALGLPCRRAAGVIRGRAGAWARGCGAACGGASVAARDSCAVPVGGAATTRATLSATGLTVGTLSSGKTYPRNQCCGGE